jgi:hypothetical protein
MSLITRPSPSFFLPLAGMCTKPSCESLRLSTDEPFIDFNGHVILEIFLGSTRVLTYDQSSAM